MPHRFDRVMRAESMQTPEFAVDVELRRYLDYLVPKINAARVAYGLASVPTFDEYSAIVRDGGRLP